MCDVAKKPSESDGLGYGGKVDVDDGGQSLENRVIISVD